MPPETTDPFERARQRGATFRRAILWILVALALVLIRQFGPQGT